MSEPTEVAEFKHEPLPVIKLSKAGEARIEAALCQAAMIGRVSSDLENQAATEVQIAVKTVVKELEDARVFFTKPLLTKKQEVDAFFGEKSKELRAELNRLMELSGSYATMMLAKQRAAENVRNEELRKQEREREQAIAQATTPAEVDAVRDHFAQVAAVVSEPPAPLVVAAKGQSIKADWDVTVSDIHLLARAHPSCVNITPRLSDIKSLLNAGVKVAGVTATQRATTVVRVPRAGKVVDV